VSDVIIFAIMPGFAGLFRTDQADVCRTNSAFFKKMRLQPDSAELLCLNLNKCSMNKCSISSLKIKMLSAGVPES
jgi:hypothetical protein